MGQVRRDDLQDLEDLAIFAAIVESGGVNQASRRLGIPKSRLSRHLAALEQRYNVELLHRSTRRFAVTDVGQALYDQCAGMLEKAQDGMALLNSVPTTPQGMLRISAPAPFCNFWLAGLLSRFLNMHPLLRVEIESRDPYMDLIDNRLDLSIQIRPLPLPDSDLVVRQLGTSRQILVAAPMLLAGFAEIVTPEDLDRMPLIGFGSLQGVTEWALSNGPHVDHRTSFRSRLATSELQLLLTAAIDGVGVSLLPEHFCRKAIGTGELVRVLSGWQGPVNAIYAAYLSRRGLSSGARAFIDFLALELPRANST